VHRAVERYLDDVLRAAELTPGDECAVREELATHLDFLEAGVVGGAATDEEVYAMVEEQFGAPDEVGGAIARAKGRFRTYLKKEARRVPLQIAVALCIVLVIKWQWVEVFRVPGDSMAPVIPAGAHVLVNKWDDVSTGDLVVFRDDDDRNIVARVDRLDASAATVSKTDLATNASGEWPRTLGRERLVGRVWFVRR
jgi:hypothetical protein